MNKKIYNAPSIKVAKVQHLCLVIGSQEAPYVGAKQESFEDSDLDVEAAEQE